jgi:hypothetical protein
MEGTRHERAALVGVAYFLGFLTTFIWLGYNTVATSTAPIIPAVAQPASVVSAVAATPEPVAPAPVAPGVVKYENGILEVSALGGSRTLSFNVDVSDDANSAEFADQGLHAGELSYAASPSGEYVFFCEQKTTEAETCSPFVYDVLADKIYRVTNDGERVDLLTSAAKTVTWSDNALVIGDVVAKDTSKPWALGN